jgi:hypothetical protein
MRSFAFLSALTVVGGVCQAATVYVNSNQLYAQSVLSSVVGAKYRLSNTNFDQSLDNGLGTTTFGAGKNTFVQAQLGTVSQLNSRTYDFALSHVAGSGFTFTLVHGQSVSSLVWDQLVPLYIDANNTVLPGASFNSLYLEMRTTSNTSAGTLCNLAFSGATVSGSFVNESITNTIAGNGGTVGFSKQRLVSDTDLSTFDWTLTGSIYLSKSVTGGDEATKFTIIGQNVEAVPEPGTMAALGLGAAFLARRRRK